MHLINKGMIQLFGITYRVARVQHNNYQVTRIRDDVLVGSFACGQTIEVTAVDVDALLMRQIASAAVRKGRTSWMGALALKLES